ncbi:MAG: hypothetical protein GXP51_11440 [Deltaproteobacteria bacterium]|nr:hypothetical protein [Deltaproteobacteria bacterium]
MSGPVASAAERLTRSEQRSSYEELLEENRLLRTEVDVSRQAAQLTAELVVEQITKIEDNYRDLAQVNLELRQALDEIRTLRGTLPICAQCKSVRDDAGYWNRIEKYLQEHSDADFTHGLCPECEEQLYGDQEWFQRLKRRREARKPG